MIVTQAGAVPTASPRIVLPEGDDERIWQAARRLADEARVQPIVLASAEQLAEHSQLAAGIVVIDPATAPKLSAYAQALSVLRPNPNPAISLRLARKPLFFGGLMLQAGDADAFLAGVRHPTARVIEAGLMTVGLAPGLRNASSFFLMQVPGLGGAPERSFIFADCAVNIEPDADTLADIAIASAVSCRSLLGVEPKVALLSFSTHGSASHASVDRIRLALARVRERAPELAIDGELQADAAISLAVAARKVKAESPVAGQANVLVFPDLNSGNIAYKLTQYLAGAQAIGPVLQGFAKPISDLSRGASVDDIVATAYLLARSLPGVRSQSPTS